MDVDTIVVGAGVVGLAVARALAAAGREVWVLEANERAGEGISSRNSGVIHAGFFYPTGSLKARMCVRGVQLLYEFCARRGVPHRRTGKLVVADEEVERGPLERLLARGLANGVGDLRWLEVDEARRLEPAVDCVAAVDSPSSGIVDVPELIMALIGEIEQRGGRVVTNTRVVAARREPQAMSVEVQGGDRVQCRTLVNAAAFGAIPLAQCIEGLDPRHVPRQYFAQGHYYTIPGRCPFTRLIYPLPEKAGLGVHLGFDLAGRVRFGPDIRFIDGQDYRFDDGRRAEFGASIRRWWPAIDESQLAPDFVGVRPKLSGPGEASADFRIDGPELHGIEGLINLFGIESPGLTSSLAIGEEVARRVA